MSESIDFGSELDKLQNFAYEVYLKCASLRKLWTEHEIAKKKKKLAKLDKRRERPSIEAYHDTKYQDNSNDKLEVDDYRGRKRERSPDRYDPESRSPSSSPKPSKRKSASRSISPISRSRSRSSSVEVERDKFRDRDEDPGPPRVEYQLFVWDLPRNVTDKQLLDSFTQIGPVYEAYHIKDWKTGRTKGMGYVKFWTVSDVNRALESEAPVFRDEDGKEHQIRMKRAETKNTVYISGIPRHLSPQKVEEEIERIGKCQITKFEIPPEKDGGDGNRGYCFASFEDREMATRAYHNLQKGGAFQGASLKMTLQETRSSGIGGSKVKALFVKGISPKVSAGQLEKLFGSEVVERVVLPSENRTGDIYGHAYVHFKSHEDALLAKDKFDGYELDGWLVIVCYGNKYLGKRIVVEWCLPHRKRNSVGNQKKQRKNYFSRDEDYPPHYGDPEPSPKRFRNNFRD